MIYTKCKAIAIVDGIATSQTFCFFGAMERRRAASPDEWETEIRVAARKALLLAHPGCEVVFSNTVQADEQVTYEPAALAAIVGNRIVSDEARQALAA